MSHDRPQTVVNVNVPSPVAAGGPITPKSLAVAVLLWLFLAGFGAHRFYLHRPHAVTMLLVTIGGVLLSVVGVGLFLLMAVGVWFLIDAFFLAKWVAEWNLHAVSLPPGSTAAFPPRSRPEKSLPLQTRLLREAQHREGKLTVTQGVAATGATFDAVKACLRDMVTDGHADVDNDPDSGAVVYVFPELR